MKTRVQEGRTEAGDSIWHGTPQSAEASRPLSRVPTGLAASWKRRGEEFSLIWFIFQFILHSIEQLFM